MVEEALQEPVFTTFIGIQVTRVRLAVVRSAIVALGHVVECNRYDEEGSD
jgi:hypothetical protein